MNLLDWVGPLANELTLLLQRNGFDELVLGNVPGPYGHAPLVLVP